MTPLECKVFDIVRRSLVPLSDQQVLDMLKEQQEGLRLWEVTTALVGLELDGLVKKAPLYIAVT